MTEKRCLYQILGLDRDCSQEEIRSAYKKLALQLHPDKQIRNGVSEEQATVSFQELVNAYEVLSDARERAWYDSHRSQILFSGVSNSSSSDFSPVDLFSFFTNSVFTGYGDSGKGFFKVYGDVFDKVYAVELKFVKKLGVGTDSVRVPPLMGNLQSPYVQVSAFYNYWMGFCTVMDFSWVDEYHASAGPNRRVRRLMEEENKKLRKKAKREYNDTVRGLAEFVKKRDKRVIEMQMKKNLEEENKRAEERARKQEEARVKWERARLYEEPDWAKIDENEVVNGFDEFTDEDRGNDGKELFCVVCSKKFKSDKQWKNHEQSKKHKEKVEELKYSFEQEQEMYEVLEDSDKTHLDFVKDGMDELSEKFVILSTNQEEDKVMESSCDVPKLVENLDDDNVIDGESSCSSADENSLLEAMVTGHKNRKKLPSHQNKPSTSDSNAVKTDEPISMHYDMRKTCRRNRRAKKKDVSKYGADIEREELSEYDQESSLPNANGDQGEEIMPPKSLDPEPVSFAVDENGISVAEKGHSSKVAKSKNHADSKKDSGIREANIKSKNSSKGKKQKSTSKSVHECETCGEYFETRNKLFMHLGDTGHAALKSR